MREVIAKLLNDLDNIKPEISDKHYDFIKCFIENMWDNKSLNIRYGNILKITYPVQPEDDILVKTKDMSDKEAGNYMMKTNAFAAYEEDKELKELAVLIEKVIGVRPKISTDCEEVFRNYRKYGEFVIEWGYWIPTLNALGIYHNIKHPDIKLEMFNAELVNRRSEYKTNLNKKQIEDEFAVIRDLYRSYKDRIYIGDDGYFRCGLSFLEEKLKTYKRENKLLEAVNTSEVSETVKSFLEEGKYLFTDFEDEFKDLNEIIEAYYKNKQEYYKIKDNPNIKDFMSYPKFPYEINGSQFSTYQEDLDKETFYKRYVEVYMKNDEIIYKLKTKIDKFFLLFNKYYKKEFEEKYGLNVLEERYQDAYDYKIVFNMEDNRIKTYLGVEL